MSSSSGRSSLIDIPSVRADWLPEPALVFGAGNHAANPKVGVPLYGPRSYGSVRHKRDANLGFIGTAEAVERAMELYADLAKGVVGDDSHLPFPGCSAGVGYRFDVHMDQHLVETISRQEALQVTATRGTKPRFEEFLHLLEAKLAILTQRDFPIDCVVLALNDELYRSCRTVDYSQKGVGKVHRDLRRAFKVLAMRYVTPTQLLHPATIGMSAAPRTMDDRATIAWNLFTGLYFKIDGLPWGPTGLAPGTCFIGISFYRPLGDASHLRTSVVQAFDENGEGLVLRGHSFPWDDGKQGRSPHLSEQQASELLGMVLDRYLGERKQTPQRIVIHKTSRFEPEERRGFERALAGKAAQRYDLVALRPTSDVRLIRTGQYPPLRGTSFSVGDTSYLYTTGYSPELGGYPHGHVPSPLQIADHVGDTTRSQLLSEILVLTKMNWNSANMAGLMPITLRFSRLVGDVLREVPAEMMPQPKYKFYM